jgi:hypothetical protein
MDFKPKITIAIDKKDKSINEEDLMEYLDTITKSCITLY